MPLGNRIPPNALAISLAGCSRKNSRLSRQETPNSVCEVYKQKVERSRRIGVQRGDGGDEGGDRGDGGGVHKALCLPRSLQTSHMSKSHCSLHLSRNLSSSKITSGAAPATNIAFGSKTAPIPCACHEKSTLKHQSTSARHHNESAVARSTRRGHPDSASLRSRNALRRFREA